MPITEAELAQARTAWGDSLIAISEACEVEGIGATQLAAGRTLDTAYGPIQTDFGKRPNDLLPEQERQLFILYRPR